MVKTHKIALVKCSIREARNEASRQKRLEKKLKGIEKLKRELGVD